MDSENPYTLLDGKMPRNRLQEWSYRNIGLSLCFMACAMCLILLTALIIAICACIMTYYIVNLVNDINRLTDDITDDYAIASDYFHKFSHLIDMAMSFFGQFLMVNYLNNTQYENITFIGNQTCLQK